MFLRIANVHFIVWGEIALLENEKVLQNETLKVLLDSI